MNASYQETFAMIKSGDHICQIYREPEDRRSAVLAFMKKGLELAEKCIVIGEGTQKADLAAQEGFEIDRVVESGRLTFLTWTDPFLKGDGFSPEGAIDFLRREEEQALKENYAGLRVSWDMTSWHEIAASFERLMEFEMELEGFFPGRKTTLLCQYGESRILPESLLEVLRVHPLVVAGELICENFYHAKEDEFSLLKRGSAREKYEQMIKHIRALTEERIRGRILHEQMSQGLILLDESLRPVEMNRAGKEYIDSFGVFAEDGTLSLLGTDELSLRIKRMQARGQPVEYEVSDLSGSGRILRVHLAPFSFPGQRNLGSLLVLSDVTNEKLLHNQLMQAEKLFSIMQMISGIAHQINNPLTSIIGFAELLLQNVELDEDAREQLEYILREGDRARKIVHSLLSFARRHKPRKEFFQVKDMLEEVVEAYRDRIGSLKVEAQINLREDIPQIYADPQQLRQVLTNVVNNALDAMETSEKKVLGIEAGREGNQIKIAISDTGCGIPPEIMSKIYDPFFTTKEVTKAAGLGLSLAWGVMQEHKGRIFARSKEGEGSTFFLELPLFLEGRKADAERKSLLAGKKVLVLEDEVILLRLLSRMLQNQAMQVEGTLDPEQALRLAARGDYDLLICDSRAVLGEEALFLRDILRVAPGLSRKVVLTSQELSRESGGRRGPAGFYYLPKPFQVEDVLKAVEGTLCEKEDSATA